MKEGNKIVLKKHEGKPYANPIIPEGFTHVCDEWNNGYKIRNMVDGSEFIWIPLGYLEADGTLDGKNFNQCFGRRNFRGDTFSENGYHEEVDSQMLESVQKYGGLYISANLASLENGKLVFKKGNMPWVEVSKNAAQEAAGNYSDGNSSIVTCLPSGAVYDSIFKWIIQTGVKTYDEVVNDSTTWGNYINAENSPKQVTPTGSNENWKVLGIYDLAGNCCELSTEQYQKFTVTRGSTYYLSGYYWSAAHRMYLHPGYGVRVTGWEKNSEYCSFRIVLYVK